jgi:uncharacterized membrane protein
MHPRSALLLLLAAFAASVLTGAVVLSCVNIGSQTYAQAEPDDLPDYVTYTQHIQPIIDAKCCNCHSHAQHTIAGLDYSTYEQVIPSTNGQGGEGQPGWQGIKLTGIVDMTMPPGGKERFTPREIALLLRWESQDFAR